MSTRAKEQHKDPMPALIKDNSAEFSDALDKLRTNIEAQFESIDINSEHISFLDEINQESLTLDVRNRISATNYEISHLQGNTVCLFNKPLLVSEIQLTSSRQRKALFFGKLKILGYKYNNKTILSHSKTMISRASPDNNIKLSYYVNETIWGFILPKDYEFSFCKATNLLDFFTNKNKISSLTQYVNDVSRTANQFINLIDNEKKNLESYLSSKQAESISTEQQIESLHKEKERIDQSIASEREILSRIRNDIEASSKDLKEAIAEKKNLEKQSNDLTERVKNIKHEREEHEKILMQTKGSNEIAMLELSTLQKQLTEIKSDINITTLDMQGFSLESRTQLGLYFKLTLSLIFLLSVIFFLIYSNAMDFSEFIDKHPNTSAWNLILSRLPLVTITTLIIGTTSAALFYLIRNIVLVSENKMNMLKAAILAEQITGSLPKDGMNEDEIRNFQKNTKIELVMGVFNRKPDVVSTESHSMLMKMLSQYKNKDE
ncbi:hypothetical protein [Vibrio navarrensis]|uniref:Uncharacterized protein n=1 Tax=Vibrio navarrensis TaxID=29495 RepID=A0AAJ4IFM7_9VIBR|nr:hypothetical protein I3X05_17490 [Vibrio navarrensis]